MKRQMNWVDSLTSSLLITIALIVLFYLIPLIAIHIQGEPIETLATVLENLWPLYLATLFALFIVTLLFFRFGLQLLSWSITLFAFFLIIASFKENPVSTLLRQYVESSFEIDYLAFGSTIAALSLAILAISRSTRHNSD